MTTTSQVNRHRSAVLRAERKAVLGFGKREIPYKITMGWQYGGTSRMTFYSLLSSARFWPGSLFLKHSQVGCCRSLEVKNEIPISFPEQEHFRASSTGWRFYSLRVILARFWPGSRSVPCFQDQIPSSASRDDKLRLSGQALRNDNFRWLCSSLVGANGCSPEKGLGWNICIYAKNETIGVGQSLFSLSLSRERGERPVNALSRLILPDVGLPFSWMAEGRHFFGSCSASLTIFCANYSQWHGGTSSGRVAEQYWGFSYSIRSCGFNPGILLKCFILWWLKSCHFLWLYRQWEDPCHPKAFRVF